VWAGSVQFEKPQQLCFLACLQGAAAAAAAAATHVYVHTAALALSSTYVLDFLLAAYLVLFNSARCSTSILYNSKSVLDQQLLL
jgi:hypothetical protein